MQGGFEEPFSLNSYINKSFENRKPITDLFSSFSIPKDVDSACKKAKENLPKFSFYYLVVGFLFSFFYLLSNRVAIIPFAICIVGYYVSQMNLKINNIELTPAIVLYCCIGINVLLAIISTSIAFSYFFLIVFSALCFIIVIGHACIIESNKEESQNEI